MNPRPPTPESDLWLRLQDYYPNRPLSSRLFPLPEHDLMYVKNPKAGSSTMMEWLTRIHTGDPETKIGHPHRDSGLPRLAEVGRPLAMRMLSGLAYCFSFVRHPVARFDSAYYDKIVRPIDGRFRAEVQRALGLPVEPSHTPSFEQFIESAELQDPYADTNLHWRPQYLNLMHGAVTYSRIGRLESFDADIALIRDEAGLPSVPIERRNHKAKVRTSSPYDGRPDLVSRVEQLFATDMELYGY